MIQLAVDLARAIALAIDISGFTAFLGSLDFSQAANSYYLAAI